MILTQPNAFFKQKRTVFEIKSELLLPCFTAWYTHYLTKTNKPAATLHYLDLLAGAGCPEDCSPAHILQNIHQETENLPELNESIKTYFFCPAKGALDKLKVEIENLEFLPALTNPPVFLQETLPLPDFTASGPCLLITDLFGLEYAQEIALKAIRNNNSDLWLLFTMNKFKTAIGQEKEESRLSELFGTNWTTLKTAVQQETNTRKREQISIEGLENALKDQKYYTVTLRINLPDKDQLSYYLVMASKVKDLYFQLREILETYSDFQPDGVPLFSINQKPQPAELPGFFRYLHPYCMENLVEELSKSRSRFHYQTIREIYETHALGTPYRLANYLQAFELLKNQGQINLLDEKNKQVKVINERAIVFYKLHSSK